MLLLVFLINMNIMDHNLTHTHTFNCYILISDILNSIQYGTLKMFSSNHISNFKRSTVLFLETCFRYIIICVHLHCLLASCVVLITIILLVLCNLLLPTIFLNILFCIKCVSHFGYFEDCIVFCVNLDSFIYGICYEPYSQNIQNMFYESHIFHIKVPPLIFKKMYNYINSKQVIH